MKLLLSVYKKLYVLCLLSVVIMVFLSLGCGGSGSDDNNFNTAGSVPSEGTQGGGDDGGEDDGGEFF